MSIRLLSPVVLFLLLVFLIGPFLIIIAASLSAGDTLAFPQGLSLRWVAKVFTIDSFRDSFAMSMFLAVFGTLAALILGIPAAYALARYRLPGSETVRTVVSLPIIVPGIIVGLALLRYLVVPFGFNITLALFFAIPPWCCPMPCVSCPQASVTCAPISRKRPSCSVPHGSAPSSAS